MTRTTRRAFTLVEVLVWVMLLAPVALLSAKAFHAMLTATRDARADEVRITAVETSLRQLRQDVWSATAIEVPSPTTLLITTPTSSIVWARSPDGTLRRATHDNPHIKTLGSIPELTFAPSQTLPNTLEVRFYNPRQATTHAILLTSQLPLTVTTTIPEAPQ